MNPLDQIGGNEYAWAIEQEYERQEALKIIREREEERLEDES